MMKNFNSGKLDKMAEKKEGIEKYLILKLFVFHLKSKILP